MDLIFICCVNKQCQITSNQDNFPELSEVWNHFDSGSCPGQAIGVRTRMDNGVMGFIPTKFLSDKMVKHPEERVKVRILCISSCVEGQ